jgi:hypothetical protein
MEENTGSSNNCGKVCLFSCLGCLGLVILLVLILFIATCAGCAGCMGGLGQAFGGLWKSIGEVSKISKHFEDLKAQGWEVDDSQSNQPSGYGSNVEADVPMIWRARENPDDEWTEYVWELSMPNVENLEGKDSSDMDWSDFANMFEMQLVPRTEAALEVHRELGLDLPDDFVLEPWAGDGGGNGTRDKENPDDEESTRSRDNGDEETGDTTGDESSNNDDRESRRRSKSFKKAA